MLSGFQTESLIKELISIINTFSNDGTYRQYVLRCIKGLLKIVFIIAIQSYVMKPDTLVKSIKGFGWSIVYSLAYKRMAVRTSVATTTTNGGPPITRKEIILKRIIASKFPYPEEYRKLLPIYKDTTDDSIFLHYAPTVHGEIGNEIEDEANSEIQDCNAQETTKYFKWNGARNRYDAMHASKMFPSKNYVALRDIIVKNVSASKLLESYSTFAISICGEPGLGKSKFSEFIATTTSGEDRIHFVYRVDLSETACMKISPEKLFEDIYFSISIAHPTIFVIDELDKCLREYIHNTFSPPSRTVVNVHPEKAKDSSAEKPGPILPPMPSLHPVLEASNAFSEDEYARMVDLAFKKHSRDVTVKYLYALLSVLERTGNKSSCAVIFSTNNFDTIFSALPPEDMIHFYSLRSRFAEVKFDRCDRAEIVNYLTYYNNIFKGTQFYVEEEELNLVLDSLREDVTITYRALTQISNLSSMDPRVIVPRLNEYRSGTFSSSQSSDDVTLESALDGALGCSLAGTSSRPLPPSSTLHLGSFSGPSRQAHSDDRGESSDDDNYDRNEGEECPDCGRIYPKYCVCEDDDGAQDQEDEKDENPDKDQDEDQEEKDKKETEDREKDPGAVEPSKPEICCPEHLCSLCEKKRDEGLIQGCICSCHNSLKAVAPPKLDSYVRDRNVVKKKYTEPYPFEPYFTEPFPDDELYNPEKHEKAIDARLSSQSVVHKVGCRWCGNFYIRKCSCDRCADIPSIFIFTRKYNLGIKVRERVEEIEKCHFCCYPEKYHIQYASQARKSTAHIDSKTIIAKIKELLLKVDQVKTKDEKKVVATEIMSVISRPEAIEFLSSFTSFKTTAISKVNEFMMDDTVSSDFGMWVDSKDIYQAVLEGYRLTAYDRAALQ